MPKKEVVRKKFRVDPDKLERARLFLGAESDTETINKALDLLLRGAPPAEKKAPAAKPPAAEKRPRAAQAGRAANPAGELKSKPASEASSRQPDAVKRSAMANKPKWAK